MRSSGVFPNGSTRILDHRFHPGIARELDTNQGVLEYPGTGEIDFLEFSQFIRSRDQVEEECETSTRELILASVDLMEPDQRERYLSMIEASADFPLTRSL